MERYRQPLQTSRSGLHTARDSLENGKILAAGGTDGTLTDIAEYVPFNSAEVYEPATGTWSVTASLNTARIFIQQLCFPMERSWPQRAYIRTLRNYTTRPRGSGFHRQYLPTSAHILVVTQRRCYLTVGFWSPEAPRQNCTIQP